MMVQTMGGFLGELQDAVDDLREVQDSLANQDQNLKAHRVVHLMRLVGGHLADVLWFLELNVTGMRKIVKKFARHVVDQFILWPHVLLSTIFHKYPAAWIARVCPSPESISTFWDAIPNSPQFSLPEIASRLDFRRKCIPISIHVDGVAVTGVGKSWGKMADV